MIELKDVYVKNGARDAASGISARLPNGRLYGVVSAEEGDSTRLLAAMSGVIPYRGKIKINGYDLRSQAKKARACLGYAPMGAPLYDSLTAVEILDAIAQVNGMAYERAVRKMNDVLRLTSLDEIRDRQAASMSEADRRLLSIAQAMMGDGDILLLNDPTRDLNRLETEEIMDLIVRLKESYTVFVASDSMEGLPLKCDSVLLLLDGALIEAPDEALLEPLRKRRPSSGTDKKARRKPKMDGEYEVIEEDDA